MEHTITVIENLKKGYNLTYNPSLKVEACELWDNASVYSRENSKVRLIVFRKNDEIVTFHLSNPENEICN